MFNPMTVVGRPWCLFYCVLSAFISCLFVGTCLLDQTGMGRVDAWIKIAALGGLIVSVGGAVHFYSTSGKYSIASSNS